MEFFFNTKIVTLLEEEICHTEKGKYVIENIEKRNRYNSHYFYFYSEVTIKNGYIVSLLIVVINIPNNIFYD